MRAVERVRDVDVEWRLFSLRLINEGTDDPLADMHERGTPALRTLALVKRERGNEGVGALYEAIGNRIHEGDEELAPEVVEAALGDAGLSMGLVRRALDDELTMKEVRAEHNAAVAEAGCFGVPTIVIESGRGIFGPVISTAPAEEEAGELWDHFSWLAVRPDFFELKRERDREPGSRRRS